MYEAIQFGHALNLILGQLLLDNRELGSVYLMKFDIVDGFYHIGLNIEYINCLGVIFPMYPVEEPLIYFPLIVSHGMEKQPFWFLRRY